MHSAILLFFVYALGPLGLLLTARGRRSGFWTAFAAGTAVLATVLGAAWWAVATRGESAALLPLLTIGTILCVVAAFTVWSRSLDLLLESHRFPGKPWPTWVRNPWLIAPLGLIAPGVAWVFARKNRRAVVTVWSGWPLGVALLLLVQAPLLWRHREVFASFGVGADSLEYMFMVVAVAALAAPLVWIGQALLGARQTAHMYDRWRSRRGDWSAAALAVAVIAMVVAIQPTQRAADLGGVAELLRDQDCQVLPLQLTSLARQLDPGQPAYALQMAELHAERGDTEAAARVRRELDQELQSYLGTLLSEGAWQRQVPPEESAPVRVNATERSAGSTMAAAATTRQTGPAPRTDSRPAVARAGFVVPGLPFISSAERSRPPVTTHPPASSAPAPDTSVATIEPDEPAPASAAAAPPEQAEPDTPR